VTGNTDPASSDEDDEEKSKLDRVVAVVLEILGLV
jgi:hypothetical protein